VHVRARRGQATDSHSLAERVSSPLIFFLDSVAVGVYANDWVVRTVVTSLLRPFQCLLSSLITYLFSSFPYFRIK
jgi:hypothetical protein